MAALQLHRSGIPGLYVGKCIYDTKRDDNSAEHDDCEDWLQLYSTVEILRAVSDLLGLAHRCRTCSRLPLTLTCQLGSPGDPGWEIFRDESIVFCRCMPGRMPATRSIKRHRMLSLRSRQARPTDLNVKTTLKTVGRGKTEEDNLFLHFSPACVVK